MTAHALITTEEMKAVMKVVDGMGAFAIFSTCEGDNWREPEGEPTLIQVVWRPKKGAHKPSEGIVLRCMERMYAVNLSRPHLNETEPRRSCQARKPDTMTPTFDDRE